MTVGFLHFKMRRLRPRVAAPAGRAARISL